MAIVVYFKQQPTDDMIRKVQEKYRDAVFKIFSTLGLPLSKDKVQIGQRLTVLGLLYELDRICPRVSCTKERKDEIIKMVMQIEESNVTGRKILERLVGKVTHVISTTTDRMFLPTINPIRKKSLEKTSKVEVDQNLRKALDDVKKILEFPLEKEITTMDPKGYVRHVYSDASWKNGAGMVGIVWVDSQYKLHARFVRFKKEEIENRVNGYPINYLETCGPLMAVLHLGKIVEDTFNVFYVDNNAALDNLLRKNAKDPYNKIISMFWTKLIKNKGKGWLQRVPSYMNIADCFTKLQKIELIREHFGWLFETIEEGMENEELFRDMVKGKRVLEWIPEGLVEKELGEDDDELLEECEESLGEEIEERVD